MRRHAGTAYRSGRGSRYAAPDERALVELAVRPIGRPGAPDTPLIIASTCPPAPRLLSTNARPFPPVVVAQVRIVQIADDGSTETRRIADGFRSTCLDQSAADLRKVEHVRPEQDRQSEGGGLEHIVSPALDQRTAYERHVRRRVEQRQLAHRITDEHLGTGAVRGPPGAHDRAEPSPARECSGLLEPLGCRGTRTSRLPGSRPSTCSKASST